MGRLQALADLLGMSQAEIVVVQAEMAEQAYKGQAQEVLRSGEQQHLSAPACNQFFRALSCSVRFVFGRRRRGGLATGRG